MAEGLRLRLRLRGCGEGSLSFGGRGRGGQELDFLADGPAEVVEGLADIAGVVVGFVGVLGAERRDVR